MKNGQMNTLNNKRSLRPSIAPALIVSGGFVRGSTPSQLQRSWFFPGDPKDKIKKRKFG